MRGLQSCLLFARTTRWRSHLSSLRVAFPTCGGGFNPVGRLGARYRENYELVETAHQGDGSSCLCGDGKVLKGSVFEPNDDPPGQQKQLREDIFVHLSEWRDNRLDKRSSKYLDFRRNSWRAPLSLNKPSKPVWVDSRLGDLDKQCQRLSVLESTGLGSGILSLAAEGQVEKAVFMLGNMDQQGIPLSVNTYILLLKACAKRKALAQARRVFAHLAKSGLESTGFLGEYMVSTLVKCNGLGDALQAFQQLSHRTVFSWSAMICGYTMLGRNREALAMYQRMLDDGVEPDAYTFVSLLKACGNLADHNAGRRIHGEVLKYNCGADSFVLRCLLDMYGKCGRIADACVVFDALPERNVVSWNVLLAAYIQRSQPDRALQLFEEMLADGVSPNDRTFVSVLQACGMLAEEENGTMLNGGCVKVMSLAKGRVLHVYAHRKLYAADVFVSSTLVSMYRKCSSIVDARNVFDGLLDRNVVTWNIMLAAYVQLGQAECALKLYEYMRKEGASPNSRTFIGLFQACAMLGEEQDVKGHSVKAWALSKGRAVHAGAWSKGFDSDVFVASTIMSMYGKCGSFSDACLVFDALSQRDVVLWNAMLGIQAEHGPGDKAFLLFEQMQDEGVSPNCRTFVSMLQACGMLAEKEESTFLDGRTLKVGSLGKGKAVHAHAVKMGCESDAFVGSTLVGMYGRCGSIQDARNVFDGLHHRNVVAWTAMLMVYVEQAQPEMALQLYRQMCEKGVSLDAWIFVSALQSCGMLAEKEDVAAVTGSSKSNLLDMGRAIHENACSRGCDTDIFVSNTLISMYSKCGSVVDARDVFDLMPKRDTVSWNAMLRAYAEQSSCGMAFQLYEQMLEEGMSPDGRTFVSLTQACGTIAEQGGVVVDGQSTRVQSLQKLKMIHAEARRKGYEVDVFVCSTLISTYAKCGSSADGEAVLEGLPRQDVVLWNAMLASYTEQGEGGKALKLYERMLEEGLTPDARSLVSAVQACGILAGKLEPCGPASVPKVLGIGKAIHGEACGAGLDVDVFVGNTLVSMYGKCRSILDAQIAFDGLVERNLVSWNAILSAYTEQGEGEGVLQLYEQMLGEGVSPDVWTFVTVARACGALADKEQAVQSGSRTGMKSLQMAKAVHAYARVKCRDGDIFVGNTLVIMYGKCGSLGDAKDVFDALTQRDAVSWNAMLAAYAEQEQAKTVLQLYSRMKVEGVSPDARTFVTIFQACGMLADMEEASGDEENTTKLQILERGKALEDDAESRGFLSDVFVGSALVAMYGKCGNIADAQRVFVGLPQPDVVACNAMLLAHAEQGEAHRAVDLYKKMQEQGVSPDARTFVSLFQVCGILAGQEAEAEAGEGGANKMVTKALDLGRAVHASVGQRGYGADVFVASSLISMYGRCGSIEEARAVFDELHEPDVVTWNSMLVAYVEHGLGDEALQLYSLMLHSGVSPNDITYVCMLQAYSSAGSLRFVREIHTALASSGGHGHQLSPHVSSVLISAYGRCASMGEAQAVFDELARPSVVCWNALIAGYARQGRCAACLRCYDEMQQTGAKPDGVTFISLLSACSHAGLVEKGVECFESMSRDHGIAPRMEHYVSMADLLGRAGCFDRLEELLSTMTIRPSLALWLCVLGACQKHGKVGLGEEAFECAVRLQPKQAAAYVLMANIYADAERPECALKVMKFRQREGAWKDPGQSWIEHEQEVHSFVVADRDRGEDRRLCDLVGQVSLQLEQS